MDDVLVLEPLLMSLLDVLGVLVEAPLVAAEPLALPVALVEPALAFVVSVVAVVVPVDVS